MANRTDNTRIEATATVGGQIINLGIFEDRTGGASDSSSTVINRGGMGPRQALGGKAEPSPVTIKRVLDTPAQGYVGTLRDAAGRAVVVVSEVILDDDRNIIPGTTTTWKGRLKSVHTSDRTAEGGAAEMIELEVIVESVSTT